MVWDSRHLYKRGEWGGDVCIDRSIGLRPFPGGWFCGGSCREVLILSLGSERIWVISMAPLYWLQNLSKYSPSYRSKDLPAAKQIYTRAITHASSVCVSMAGLSLIAACAMEWSLVGDYEAAEERFRGDAEWDDGCPGR